MYTHIIILHSRGLLDQSTCVYTSFVNVGIPLQYNLSCVCVCLQNQENDTLKQVLQKYIDQSVQLVVYSSKTRSIRGKIAHVSKEVFHNG